MLKADPETYLIPVILITALSEKQHRVEGIKKEKIHTPMVIVSVSPNIPRVQVNSRGYPGEQITALRRAGVVHDIRKLAVPILSC